MAVAFSLALLIGTFIVVGALIAARRPSVVDPATLIQGMFRYEADLGWPHGVQESDGERAWLPVTERPVAPSADAPTPPATTAGHVAAVAAADAATGRPASTWEPLDAGWGAVPPVPVALIRVRRA